MVTLAETPRPEGAQAQMSLGDALAAQGRHAEAATSYLAAYHALDRCPPARKTAVIWREIADRLTGCGQSEVALTAYRRALDTVGVRSTTQHTANTPSAVDIPSAMATPSAMDTSGAALRRARSPVSTIAVEAGSVPSEGPAVGRHK